MTCAPRREFVLQPSAAERVFVKCRYAAFNLFNARQHTFPGNEKEVSRV
jgi:hypothetical protein